MNSRDGEDRPLTSAELKAVRTAIVTDALVARFTAILERNSLLEEVKQWSQPVEQSVREMLEELFEVEDKTTDLECKSCGTECESLKTCDGDPEGIRRDRRCPSCGSIWGVTKGCMHLLRIEKNTLRKQILADPDLPTEAGSIEPTHAQLYDEAHILICNVVGACNMGEKIPYKLHDQMREWLMKWKPME